MKKLAVKLNTEDILLIEMIADQCDSSVDEMISFLINQAGVTYAGRTHELKTQNTEVIKLIEELQKRNKETEELYKHMFPLDE